MKHTFTLPSGAVMTSTFEDNILTEYIDSSDGRERNIATSTNRGEIIDHIIITAMVIHLEIMEEKIDVDAALLLKGYLEYHERVLKQIAPELEYPLSIGIKITDQGTMTKENYNA